MAKELLAQLRGQIRQVEESAKRLLPGGAKVEVTTVSSFPRKPALHIAAHLLDGHSADEVSPYVVGDCDSHERLTRLVRLRCANIVKAVSATDMSEASVLVIKAQHGGRTYQGHRGSPMSHDIAATIYQVSIPMEKLKAANLSGLEPETVMAFWNVDMNITPDLSVSHEVQKEDLNVAPEVRVP